MRHNEPTLVSLALTVLLLVPGIPVHADDRDQEMTETPELAIEMADARTQALAEMRADITTSIRQMASEANVELGNRLAREAVCRCQDTPCHDAADGECRLRLSRKMPAPPADDSRHLVRR